MSKKGQMNLQGLATVAISFIVIAIVLGVGIRIVTDIGETMLASETVGNETSNTLTTATNYTVVLASRGQFILDTGSVAIRNETGPTEFILNTDYLVYDNGVISWINTTEPPGTSAAAPNGLNITYTASYSNDSASASIGNGSEGIAELASWLPTIALIIAAAVILGIIALYFYVRNT